MKKLLFLLPVFFVFVQPVVAAKDNPHAQDAPLAQQVVTPTAQPTQPADQPSPTQGVAPTKKPEPTANPTPTPRVIIAPTSEQQPIIQPTAAPVVPAIVVDSPTPTPLPQVKVINTAIKNVSSVINPPGGIIEYIAPQNVYTNSQVPLIRNIVLLVIASIFLLLGLRFTKNPEIDLYLPKKRFTWPWHLFQDTRVTKGYV